MMKKILASLLALLMAFGLLTVAAAAEDGAEPVEPAEPVYESVTYKIEDLVAAFEGDDDVYLQPTDVILLPEAAQADEQETDGGTPLEGDVTEASKAVLIVEYLPGGKEGEVVSENKVSKFADYDGSGYAICGIGDETDFAYTATGRSDGYRIDYKNENEFAFKQWKIVSIYSGSEFSRIVLEAEWEEPALTGWAGFKTMMRNYIKKIIDYIIEYLKEWLSQLGDFIGGEAA